jgi:hypothetical protein
MFEVLLRSLQFSCQMAVTAPSRWAKHCLQSKFVQTEQKSPVMGHKHQYGALVFSRHPNGAAETWALQGLHALRQNSQHALGGLACIGLTITLKDADNCSIALGLQVQTVLWRRIWVLGAQ